MEVLNASFRRSVLAACVRDHAFLADKRVCINPDLFPDGEERDTAETILDYYDEYHSAPDEGTLETLLEERGWDLDDIDGAIASLYHDEVPNLRFAEDRVVEFSKSRRIEVALEEAAEMLGDGNLEDVRKMLLDAIYFGDDEVDRGSFWDEDPKARLVAYRKQAQARTSTGIASLDEILDGGTIEGEELVILAPPNGGKSTALINLGKAEMLAGKRVLHVTCEMSRTNVLRRYDMSLTGMTKQALRKQQKTAFRKLQEVMRQMQDKCLHIKEYNQKQATPASLSNYLEILRDRDDFHPDCVIVDYAALLSSSRKYNDLRHELADVHKALRQVAQQHRVRMITAHQTNRGGLEKELIDMSDLGECFEIGAIADVIVSLNQTDEEKRAGLMRLHLAKNREEQSGVTTTVGVDYSTCRIFELESDFDNDEIA